MCYQAEFVITVRPINDPFRFAFRQSIPSDVFDLMTCPAHLYPHLFVHGLAVHEDSVDIIFHCACGAIQTLAIVNVGHIYRQNQLSLHANALAAGYTSKDEYPQYILAEILFDMMHYIRAQARMGYAINEYANEIGRQIYEGAVERKN